MNPTCLDYCLTEAEHQQFERDGYFILEDVLSSDQIQRLSEAADRVDAEKRAKRGLEPHARLSVRDFIARDAAFMELVDWHKTFPKVWGILGWNLQIYHSHLTMTPPQPTTNGRDLKLSWHQDSGRLNAEMETNPRPRVSLKVAYFLTSTSEPGRGNFYIIPGSQLQNQIDFPNGDRKSEVKVKCPRACAKRVGGIFRSAALAFGECELLDSTPQSAVLRIQLSVVASERRSQSREILGRF